MVYEDASYIGVEIKNKSGASILFLLATEDNRPTQKHELQVGTKTYTWIGALYKTTLNPEKTPEKVR